MEPKELSESVFELSLAGKFDITRITKELEPITTSNITQEQLEFLKDAIVQLTTQCKVKDNVIRALTKPTGNFPQKMVTD